MKPLGIDNIKSESTRTRKLESIPPRCRAKFVPHFVFLPHFNLSSSSTAFHRSPNAGSQTNPSERNNKQNVRLGPNRKRPRGASRIRRMRKSELEFEFQLEFGFESKSKSKSGSGTKFYLVTWVQSGHRSDLEKRGTILSTNFSFTTATDQAVVHILSCGFYLKSSIWRVQAGRIETFIIHPR